MKNILNKTRTYLIGQMQYLDGSSWRNIVQNELNKLGIVTFNPYNHPFINSSVEDNDARTVLENLIKEKKYSNVSNIMRKIRVEDLRCVDICDFCFVYIDPKYPTVGSWEEIFWANRMKKPIFFCVEGGIDKLPLWMYGVIPHKYVYENIYDAIDTLKKINSGEKEIDSDRWRLLRPEYR
jgi:hypothetical protein